MKSYFFTFGPVHYTKKGLPMRNKWVQVHAASPEEALAIFQRDFMAPVMQKPNRWEAQHDEAAFNQIKPLKDGGEFAVLNPAAA